MAKKRGFFAEMQRQNQLAAKRAEQERRAAHRAQAAAFRELEKARKSEERARSQLARATAQELKAAERAAKKAHEEARQAEVEEWNSRLAQTYDEIDSLLAATLEVDDFVDLNTLRTVAEHPPFPRPDLEQPLPPPVLVQAPPEPQFVEPPRPSGLRGVFSSKAHAEAIEAARADFDRAHAAWRHHVAEVPAAQARQIQEHQAAEQQRIAVLEELRAVYTAECEAREAEAAESNRELDELIAGLANGDEAAVQEYVAVVLANSVYPEAFPVSHEHSFDSSLRELQLTVLIPPPDAVPAIKAYRYVKASDEITESALPQKAQKDRYLDAVRQVALRSLHEVFEADRSEWVQTIALTVATDTVDPATGLGMRSTFLAVATDRTFAGFDLANVDPAATLVHLGAQVSKNPHGLVSIDTSKGVRTT